MNSIRDDFPLLSRKINGNPLIYFDNAATTPKPQIVLDALVNHYSKHSGNPGRGTHTLSYESLQIINSARDKVLEFLHAPKDLYHVIFTKNATESLNLASFLLKSATSVITTVSEHHSNFLPWKRTTQQNAGVLSIVPVNEYGQIDLVKLEQLAQEKPRSILAITHASNVTGQVTDLKTVCEIAEKYALTTVLDATQTIAHQIIDLEETPVDFLAASAHKMYGPEGVGVLVVKKHFTKGQEPLLLGGGSVEQVTLDVFNLKETEEKFEAGTINTSGIAGLCAAIEYIENTGLKTIIEKENELLRYFLEKAASINELSILGEGDTVENSLPVISFTLGNIHPHDVADFLDKEGIAIRAGFHCAQPLHIAMGSTATIRVSLSFFNEKSEIDHFFTTIKQCLQKFA